MVHRTSLHVFNCIYFNSLLLMLLTYILLLFCILLWFLCCFVNYLKWVVPNEEGINLLNKNIQVLHKIHIDMPYCANCFVYTIDENQKRKITITTSKEDIQSSYTWQLFNTICKDNNLMNMSQHAQITQLAYSI